MRKTFCADPDRLASRLGRGEVVPVRAEDWDALAGGFQVVESHDTGLAGELLLARHPRRGRQRRWVLIEEPDPDERVVRPLADEATARALIADRLATYERMWDG